MLKRDLKKIHKRSMVGRMQTGGKGPHIRICGIKRFVKRLKNLGKIWGHLKDGGLGTRSSRDLVWQKRITRKRLKVSEKTRGLKKRTRIGNGHFGRQDHVKGPGIVQ